MRDSRRTVLVVALLSGVGGGCAPRMIQDYTLRKNELVFAVQRGTSDYSIGVCARDADGNLTNCQRYEVEFE